MVFCFHQTGEAFFCRLPLLFILAFKDGSAVETKTCAEPPLAVNRADRIRFNTALDFSQPSKKR